MTSDDTNTPSDTGVAVRSLPLQFHPDDFMALYVCRDWEGLSTGLLEQLEVLANETFISLGPEAQAQLNVFVSHFLFLFSKPEYVIPKAHRVTFVAHNAVVSNAVAMSSFKTTDAWLPLVSSQPDNLSKLLTLYSPRNTTRIDPKVFFDASPMAASVWYAVTMEIFTSALCEPHTHERLRELLAGLDARFIPRPGTQELFFAASYIDEGLDRKIREHINAGVRREVAPVVAQLPRVEVRPRRIGIVTANWLAHHSVYRNHYDLVAALKADYDLVLIHTGATLGEDIDQSLFSEVVHVAHGQDGVTFDTVSNLGCRMLFYVDVGLTQESITLSNARLAPIQATCYGHSVSSFGADLDYYLASDTVEMHRDLSRNYGERPVLLDGLGVTNTVPLFEPPVTRSLASDRILVGCSWYSQKVNYALVQALQQVQKRSAGHKIVFRMFSGSGLLRHNNFLPFAMSVRESLGIDSVDVLPPLKYDDYMSDMARCHFALEPFHFGGCNTVIDSLHLRQPIVTLEGGRWYSRVGSYFLRSVGLDELIAATVEEYIEKAVRLVVDRPYREGLQDRIDCLDLSPLYSKAYASEFKSAIDYLMANHERLQAEQSKVPIRMSAVMANRV